MKYFFILGNHPSLSIAELFSYFERSGYPVRIKQSALTADNQTVILDIENEPDMRKVIREIGGTVKLGISNFEFRISNDMYDIILEKIIGMTDDNGLVEGKYNFGISVYGSDKINTKHLGMTLKTRLKEQGRSCRWVVSREKNLSSVVVETNNLIEKGMEIVIIRAGGNIYLGKTLAVQPFKELSFRDFGRPDRDDHSGMIPPKLAQIMLNLAGAVKDDIILDPFCGSGTIVTEAMLLGYENIIGSDISKKAVEDTKRNVEWTIKKLPAHWRRPGKVESRKLKVKFFQYDAERLSGNIPHGSIGAIVTEPYLGPQRGRNDAYEVKKELELLYKKSLAEFKKILSKKGRVVMVWPILRHQGNNIFLDKHIAAGYKIYEPIILPGQSKTQDISPRGTFVYGRAGQKVWREIVVMGVGGED